MPAGPAAPHPDLGPLPRHQPRHAAAGRRGQHRAGEHLLSGSDVVAVDMIITYHHSAAAPGSRHPLAVSAPRPLLLRAGGRGGGGAGGGAGRTHHQHQDAEAVPAAAPERGRGAAALLQRHLPARLRAGRHDHARRRLGPRGAAGRGGHQRVDAGWPHRDLNIVLRRWQLHMLTNYRYVHYLLNVQHISLFVITNQFNFLWEKERRQQK